MMNCPVCENNTLIEGERVDVGFGSHMGVQCSPDCCEYCGYVQAGPDPFDLQFSHFEKCWELQVEPHPPQVKIICKLGVFDEKYLPYIEKDSQKAYGDCFNLSLKMNKLFPELRIIEGTVVDWLWGVRDHYWCVDPFDVIVDPTASQFPGLSHYTPHRYLKAERLQAMLDHKEKSWILIRNC